jgi:hypothetical protein
MSARLHTHNDLPSAECHQGREKLVQQIAREIAVAEPPLVFGIHGDWGAGKTSFLCQLAHELSRICPLYPKHPRNRVCHDIDHVFTVWFEAWRYQHEPAPVVALLHELCRQLPKHQKIKDWLMKAGVVLTKGIFGTIEEVSADIEAKPFGTGGKVSVKARNPLKAIAEEENAWDEARFAGRLTTERLRDLLSQAIGKLVDRDNPDDPKKPRVCVIIDDLDRCQPDAALRLLEGIKIYLTIPQCVFVLGVNIRQIQQAIAPLLPGAKMGEDDDAEQQAEAAEYLEKLCTFTWKLPFLAPKDCADLLHTLLGEPSYIPLAQQVPLSPTLRQSLRDIAEKRACLPANPRKIKALANTIRQLTEKVWGASPATNGCCAAPDDEAEALLAASSVYHFHPQLLRHLQSWRGAWTQFVNWLGGKSDIPETSDFGQLLKKLRPLTVTQPGSETTATPRSATRLHGYSDPIHLNVLRIETLLRDGTDATKAGTITPERIAAYLDLPL